MDQHRGSSRPRPANTSHCQKSGTLELKGQKSKVFAALSLPEMWLYKSEQVGGQTRHPTVPMVDGGESDRGSLAKVSAKGRAERKRMGRRKGMVEILHGAAIVGAWAWRCWDCQERTSPQYPPCYQIVFISAWHLSLSRIKLS